MKKTILFMMTCVLAVSSVSAQKQQFADLITQKHKWVYAYTFEKAVMLNASDKMWEMLQSENKTPKGHNSFRILSDALMELSDKFGGTTLSAKCGSGVSSKEEESNRPGCQSTIDGWNGKYSITINAQNVPVTNEGYRLLNGYTTTLAYLFNADSRSLWRSGYAPKAEKQHYIINMDNKYKDVQTSWSKDGVTFTINAPADIEVSEWDRKIENGFKVGWIKK